MYLLKNLSIIQKRLSQNKKEINRGEHHMLLKNKVYLSIVIFLFIVACILAFNESLIGSDLGNRIFNIILVTNTILVFVGTIVQIKKK